MGSGSKVNWRSTVSCPISAIQIFRFRVKTMENGSPVYGGKVGVRLGSGERVAAGMGEGVNVMKGVGTGSEGKFVAKACVFETLHAEKTKMQTRSIALFFIGSPPEQRSLYSYCIFFYSPSSHFCV